MNEQEINRIEAEAEAEDGGAEVLQAAEGGPVAVVSGDAGLVAELAAFLNMAADVAGIATRLPVSQRFTPEANTRIAEHLVKVCDTYGWDARAVLIGGDSKLGVWLGLGVAIAVPGFAVWGDYKLAKAREVQEVEGGEGGGSEEANGQQSS